MAKKATAKPTAKAKPQAKKVEKKKAEPVKQVAKKAEFPKVVSKKIKPTEKKVEELKKIKVTNPPITEKLSGNATNTTSNAANLNAVNTEGNTVLTTPAPTPISKPIEVKTVKKPLRQELGGSGHFYGKQTFGEKTIHLNFITAVKKRADGGGLLTPEYGTKDLAVSAAFMKENQPKPNNYFIIGEGGKMSYLSEKEFNDTYQS